MKAKEKVENLISKERYLMLSFAFMPLLMSVFLTLDHSNLPKVLFVRVFALIFLSLIIASILIRGRRVYFGPTDIWLLFFLICFAISTAFSIEVSTSIHGTYMRYDGLLTIFNYALLYLIALQVGRNERDVDNFSKLLIATGGIVSVYGLFQAFGFDFVPWSIRVFEPWKSFSTFGNPNFLGGFLVLILPLSIAVFLKSRGLLKNIFYGIAFGLVSIVLVTTHTRGAWIAGLISIFTFAILGWQSLIKQRLKIFALALLFFIAMASLIATTNIETGLVERVLSATRINEGSISNRIEIWKGALNAIANKPVLGYGPDNFLLAFQEFETLAYAKSGGGMTYPDNPHNWYLQIGTGAGLLALTFLLAFFTGSLRSAFSGILKTTHAEHILLSAYFSAIAGYLVHIFFTISVVGSSALLWFFIGLLLAQTRRTKSREMGPKDNISFMTRIFIAIVLVISALSVYYASRMFVADYHLRQASFKASAHNFEAASYHYEFATLLYPNSLYYLEAGRFYENLSRRSKDNLWFALEKYALAVELAPHRAENRIRLGGAYSLAQERPKDENYYKAIQELSTAIKLRPYSFQGHFLLGSIYQSNGEFEEAIPHLKKALEINPNDAVSKKLLDLSYQELFKKEQ